MGVLQLEKEEEEEKDEKVFFQFDTFSNVQMDPFLTKHSFDGIVTITSIEVQMTAN